MTEVRYERYQCTACGRLDSHHADVSCPDGEWVPVSRVPGWRRVWDAVVDVAFDVVGRGRWCEGEGCESPAVGVVRDVPVEPSLSDWDAFRMRVCDWHGESAEGHGFEVVYDAVARPVWWRFAAAGSLGVLVVVLWCFAAF